MASKKSALVSGTLRHLFNQYLMTPDCVLKLGVEEVNEWPFMIK